MHLVVDEAGEQQFAGEVVFMVGFRAGGDYAKALDATGADQDVGAEAPAFVDDFGVAEDDGGHGQAHSDLNPVHRKRETSNQPETFTISGRSAFLTPSGLMLTAETRNWAPRL